MKKFPGGNPVLRNSKILWYKPQLGNILYQFYCTESQNQLRIFSKVISNISNFNKQAKIVFKFNSQLSTSVQLSIDQCSPDHWVNGFRIRAISMEIALFSIQMCIKKVFSLRLKIGHFRVKFYEKTFLVKLDLSVNLFPRRSVKYQNNN